MKIVLKHRSLAATLAILVVLLIGVASQSCHAANLLANGGFESWGGAYGSATNYWGAQSGVTQGWHWEFAEPSPVSYMYPENEYSYPAYAGGSNALRTMSDGGSQVTMRVWQDVPVATGVQHTASVMCRAIDYSLDGTGFGSSYDDRASLIIEKYDAQNQLVGSVLITSITAADPGDAYQPMSIIFTPESNVVKVRYKLETSLACHWLNGWATYDSAVLDGPASAQLTGTVTSNGQPVEGATVSIVGGSSATTNASGSYVINVTSIIGQTINVRTSKSGYYTIPSVVMLASGPNTLNVELVPLEANLYGLNLLANPSFDIWGTVTNAPGYSGQSGTYQGWDYLFDDTISYIYPESTRAGALVFGGADAIRMMSNGMRYYGAPGTMQLSQDIPVITGQHYVAGVWVRTIGTFGADPGDYASLIVEEYTADGTLIGTARNVNVTNADPVYRRLSISFDAAENTAKVRYILKTCIADSFEYGWATFDDAMFDGPGTATVDGTVVAGGAPISGATVTVGDLPEMTTDAQGKFSFNADAYIGQVISIRVSKAQYYVKTQQLAVKAGSNPIEIDLVYRGNNLLWNPSFEDTVDLSGSSWSRYNYQGDLIVNTERWSSQNWYLTNLQLRTGANAACIWSLNGNGEGKFWQDVPVLGGNAYTARCYFKAGTHQTIPSTWGTNPDQKAAMFVQQLDINGNVTVDHGMIYATLADISQWEQLSLSIPSTHPQTVKIRVGGWAQMKDAYGATHARAVFDDFTVEGPMGPSGLSGTVLGDGGALANAVINIWDWSGGTDPNQMLFTNLSGQYAGSGIQLGNTYSVTAYKAGYYTQIKARQISGLTKADFNLVSVGNNLLINPGFDSPSWSQGWTFSGTSAGPESYFQSAFNSANLSISGEQAVSFAAPNGNGETTAYQEVAVLANTQYTARCQFRAGTDSRYPSVWGSNPAQKAALWVEEYDADGLMISGLPRILDYAELANLSAPETLELTFTTSPVTAKVKVGGYAFMVDASNSNLGRAIFDSFELNGPAPVEAGITIAQAKASSNGTQVNLKGKIVTAVYVNSCYIEEPDRSAGVLVNGYTCEPGGIVDIKGTVTTNSTTEKAINITSSAAKTAGSPLDPVGTGARGTVLTSGLPASGLYVTAWGSVESVVGKRAVINDGGASLRVILPAGVSVATGDYISVTGALGTETVVGESVSVLRGVTVTKQN